MACVGPRFLYGLAEKKSKYDYAPSVVLCADDDDNDDKGTR